MRKTHLTTSVSGPTKDIQRRKKIQQTQNELNNQRKKGAENSLNKWWWIMSMVTDLNGYFCRLLFMISQNLFMHHTHFHRWLWFWPELLIESRISFCVESFQLVILLFPLLDVCMWDGEVEKMEKWDDEWIVICYVFQWVIYSFTRCIQIFFGAANE